MKVAIISFLALILIVFYPLTVIWSLNTIFPVLQIGYGIPEWISVIILSLFVRNVTLKD